jgi:GGDEF domain-containing protein
VQAWHRGMLKSLFVPGGLLLLIAAVLLHGGIVPISASAVAFYYYSMFAAGVLLAWRFNSSQILLSLIYLFLAHRAVEFFSASHALVPGPGRIAFEAMALLLPLNLIFLSLKTERGVRLSSFAPNLIALFIQSVFVAVICGPGSTRGPGFLRWEIFSRHWFRWTPIPQLSLFILAAAIILALVRILQYRKPIDGGFLWVFIAIFAAFQSGTVGRVATAYWSTGALVLLSSLVETSYTIAYHDELTSLPSRRAFNDALLGLQKAYAVAAVDIDHFKSVNDTYGHDIGDEVLRMVAARLARITGGGTAYRVGGEEFTILFPGKSVNEVAPHLEELRLAVAKSVFRFRGGQERRTEPRGPDRRSVTRKKKAGMASNVYRDGLSVTVSIGLAEATAQTSDPQQVIQVADKALYRAKRGGRNRIEQAGNTRTRAKQSIA